jgi:YVTN family beta-propeller protein
VDPTTDTVWTANAGDGTVSVINGATNTLATSITVGGVNSDLAEIAADPATANIYVGDLSSATVSVISEATDAVTTTISAGQGPAGLAVDSATNTIYVADDNSGDSSVIDGATDTVTGVSIGFGTQAAAFSPFTHAAYLTSVGSNDVYVITPQASDTDLSITPPANVTTDADDTSPPAAACTPASGSTFAIGTTTVNCSATDSDDTPSTVTTSFTVTVEGAAAQLAGLSQAVQGVGKRTTLADSVAAVQQQLAAGDTSRACRTLTRFIADVNHQTPRYIPAATAAQLIADAQRIQAVLAC